MRRSNMTGTSLELRFPRCRPLAVGVAFHPHASAGGIAIDPTRERCDTRSRITRALVWPLRVEAESDLAIAPRSGDGASITKVAGPRPRHFPVIASELQRAVEGPGVARNAHLPRAAGVRAVLHRQRDRVRDADI